MKRQKVFLSIGLIFVATFLPNLTLAEPQVKVWPEVLLIDDFEAGVDAWENQDSGKIEWVEDAAEGKKALKWTAADDGIGHIVLKNVDRSKVDFSQYDLLTFWVKFEGKRIWNLNPIVQQFPAVYGYRGLYYSVDTMETFGEWFLYTQDLRRWENAWPTTFDKVKQEFQFEVAQLAGAGSTRVYLDGIRLLKNPLGIERSYPGRWGLQRDGSQVTHFRVKVRNSGDKLLNVKTSLVPHTLNRFRAELPAQSLALLPGEEGEVFIRILAPANVIAEEPRHYGETATIALSVEDVPGLVLHTELSAGTRPETMAHPSILMDSSRMLTLQRNWKNPDTRKESPRDIQHFVRLGEAALDYTPEFPPLACAGRTSCFVESCLTNAMVLQGSTLNEISVPNLPFSTYQCFQCGRTYTGPMFDAGMKGWAGKHLLNASQARNLGFAYGITGRKEFATAAAAILRGYIDTYLKLPIVAPEPGSPVNSHTSGAVRIASTYMREKNWLTGLAIALDFIRPAGVLTDQELAGIRDNVFVPSANLMMDHKVGAMNLQWMIESSALYAGLAAESPSLLARSMYDKHGISNLIRVGYLSDGNWWENPSYQNVANGVAFPVLATCINGGLVQLDERLTMIFKAAYKLYAPDGRGPTLGTGGPGGYHYSDNAVHSLAGLVSDPELAWVAYHRKMWVAWSGGGQPYESYLWALTWQSKPKVPIDKAVSPIPNKTTVLPDYGGIAMRVPDAGNYCYMHFGRELVHGHRNKLSVNAYGKGGWFVRNVMGGYGSNFKNFLETIASSTSIMIDGENPDADTGELLYQNSGQGWEAASAREVGAYKSVEHERSLLETKDALIVIDRCLAGEQHTYDWLYHTSLTGLSLETEGMQTLDIDRFGDSVLYESLHPSGKFDSVEKAHLKRPDGSGLKILFVGEGDLSAFKALKKDDGLLWRKRGKTTGFACVYLPYAKGEQVDGSISPLTVTDAAGKEVGLELGQAFEVKTPGGLLTILVNYSGKELRCGELRGMERVLVK
ncbi:MAG: hypothetical protein O2857_26100 [Planctomycetota bacterium]|nr:hypothetical protein [Planctomycetota bacterium]